MPSSSDPQTGRSLDRSILRLAIPNVIATLSVPLVGIADTALVGHLPEVAFMGAVAVGAVVFDTLFWGCAFLRMGTTALIAQHHGAGRREACSHVLMQALMIAGLLGAALFALQGPIGSIGFEVAGGSEEVRHWAQRYFAIRMFSAPLVLATHVVVGFFRGLADAVTPMWMTVLIHLTNVAADAVLIYGLWGAPRMGVEGAAWASVMAYGVGIVYAAAALARRYRTYLRMPTRVMLARAALRTMAGTHLNLFGRTACLLFTQFFMLSLVARMGEGPLAAHAVLWQIWSLVSYCVDGFAHASETLVGMRLGARDFTGARRVAARSLWWGTLIGAGYSAVYFGAIGPIASVFTDHARVVERVTSMVVWVAACQPLNGAVFMLDGILIGANDTRYLFGAMAVAAFGVFLPATLVFVNLLGLGLTGAWMGYNCLMLGRLATLGARYRGRRWERARLDEAGPDA